MRNVTLNIWLPIAGKDIHWDTVSGNLEYVMDYVRQHTVIKLNQPIRDTLNKAAWNKGVHWLGGHQVGLEISKIE